MANLKVAIVIRPGRPGYYLSYYEGSQQRYKKAGDNLDDAEIAKMRKEKVLRAASYGISLPEEPVRATKSHRIADCINAYIALISKPDKNGDVRAEKSLNSTRSELERFHVWSKKTYLEDLTRPLLERWRDELNQEYEPDTVVNKLMTVGTFWKHNPVVPQRKR